MNMEKFTRLMMMTTSKFDGEALNAIRLANAMLVADKKTWKDMLKDTGGVPNYVEERSAKEAAWHAQEKKREETKRAKGYDDNLDLIDSALDSVHPRSQFYQVILNIKNRYFANGRLSDREREVLESAIKDKQQRGGRRR
jgi:hypothetical protein